MTNLVQGNTTAVIHPKVRRAANIMVEVVKKQVIITSKQL